MSGPPQMLVGLFEATLEIPPTVKRAAFLDLSRRKSLDLPERHKRPQQSHEQAGSLLAQPLAGLECPSPSDVTGDIRALKRVSDFFEGRGKTSVDGDGGHGTSNVAQPPLLGDLVCKTGGRAKTKRRMRRGWNWQVATTTVDRDEIEQG